MITPYSGDIGGQAIGSDDIQSFISDMFDAYAAGAKSMTDYYSFSD